MVSLRYAALGLLAQEPGSGYDLLKKFEFSMANVWPATQSQLYGELNKLADAGLIEVTDIGPRGRKVYRVTDAGRADLVEWITHPADDQPLRNASLLRVFLLGEVSAAQALENLEQLAAGADAALKRYEGIRDSVQWDDSDRDFYGRIALEYGLRRAVMDGEWARWAMSAVRSRPTG